MVRPSAWILDQWLGREAIQYYHERHLKDVIRSHMEEEGSMEGKGFMFLMNKFDSLISIFITQEYPVSCRPHVTPEKALS